MDREAEGSMTGAQIVCKSLQKEGVEVIFGIPGGPILPLHDALLQYPGIHHVLVRHEQAAAFAADGYARASGKVGVCLATSGPGALNLVTGIAGAHMDSSSVVAITGQVPEYMIGKDGFQEADSIGALLPFTKYRSQVRLAEELALTMRKAFYLARTGRWGPVHIDIPADVFRQEAFFNYPAGDPVILGYGPRTIERKGRISLMEKQVDKAIKLIEKARKPVIIAGKGIINSEAYDELKMLVEKIQAPIVTTLLGLSAFPQDHHLNLGMLGMHGTDLANTVVNKADLIIVIGMRLDDRATATGGEFAANANVIHVDIDPAEIGKNVRADVPIVGDAKRVLSSFNAKLPDQHHKEWLDQIDRWRVEFPRNQVRKSELLLPQYCIERIYEITEGKANIVTGVGQNQMWAAQYFVSREPNRFISSGGLGSMGFGLGAAIGVQIARPGELTWLMNGDGSAQMDMLELVTVVQERLPIKIAIINNGYLGMVRQHQEEFYGGRYAAVSLLGPDWIKFADSYGVPALRVTKNDEVVPALREAMEYPGPFLIDFQVDPEANVRPFTMPALPKVNHTIPEVESGQEEGVVSGKKKRVLVALVENSIGVIEEAASLFRRRGLDLASVTVGPSEKKGVFRMTVVVLTDKGIDTQQARQAKNQLDGLVTIRDVVDVTDEDFVGQELVLIQVNQRRGRRRAILQAEVDRFGDARILEVTPKSVFIKVTGTGDEVKAFIEGLEARKYYIEKIASSSFVALKTD